MAILARLRGYWWDSTRGQYISKWNNRYVKESTVLRMAENYQKVVENNLRSISQNMIDGKISLSQWQTQMAKEVKDGWIVSVTIGRGGRDQMTQSDWGRVGARLRNEYNYLNEFAIQIKDGAQSEKQILYRSKQYAQGVRVGYYDGLTTAKEESIYNVEKRVLDAQAEHCDDCVAYAGFGWMPIGSLPEPGDRCQCMSNCRCKKIYDTVNVDLRGENDE